MSRFTQWGDHIPYGQIASCEYVVWYPGHINLVEHQHRLFDKATHYRSRQFELSLKSYTLFRSLPMGFLWRGEAENASWPEYVYVIFYDRQDYIIPPKYQEQDSAYTVTIGINTTETLITFARMYHLPLFHASSTEEAEWMRSGYESAYFQYLSGWTEDEHFDSLTLLDSALDYAQTAGKCRLDLMRESGYEG